MSSNLILSAITLFIYFIILLFKDLIMFTSIPYQYNLHNLEHYENLNQSGWAKLFNDPIIRLKELKGHHKIFRCKYMFVMSDESDYYVSFAGKPIEIYSNVKDYYFLTYGTDIFALSKKLFIHLRNNYLQYYEVLWFVYYYSLFKTFVFRNSLENYKSNRDLNPSGKFNTSKYIVKEISDSIAEFILELPEGHPYKPQILVCNSSYNNLKSQNYLPTIRYFVNRNDTVYEVSYEIIKYLQQIKKRYSMFDKDIYVYNDKFKHYLFRGESSEIKF